MATYNGKKEESFITKLQIFLFTKAFNGHIKNYLSGDNSKILSEFETFKLTEEIANIYSSEYYQNNQDKKITYCSISMTNQELLNNLLDGSQYMISKANIKNLGEIYYKLKDSYNKLFEKLFPRQHFNELINLQECSYCGVTLKQISLLGKNNKLHNKRSETRGYVLELDRKSPNLEYTENNCCMSCYWCNNAKTDEFLPSEFKEIARGINTAWNKRLKIITPNVNETICFPENSPIWDK